MSRNRGKARDESRDQRQCNVFRLSRLLPVNSAGYILPREADVVTLRLYVRLYFRCPSRTGGDTPEVLGACNFSVGLEMRRMNLGNLGSLHRCTRAKRVLGAVVVALIPWSAAAGDAIVPSKTPLRNALTEVRTRDVAPPRPTRTVARRSEQPSNPARQSPAFFKTPAGIAVLAVVGAGAGYAIYSAQHDRIHSPGKK